MCDYILRKLRKMDVFKKDLVMNFDEGHES